jgi:hypothetical protein
MERWDNNNSNGRVHQPTVHADQIVQPIAAFHPGREYSITRQLIELDPLYNMIKCASIDAYESFLHVYS